MIVYKVYKETLTCNSPITWVKEFLPCGTFYDVKAALKYKKLGEEQDKENCVIYGIEVKEL